MKKATSAPCLPRPRFVTPAHPDTWCALNAAYRLARLLEPGDSKRRKQAQARIQEACHSGDLKATMAAISDAANWFCATPEWVQWASDWQSQVSTTIFSGLTTRGAA
jgi:hypothetical protein